MPITTRELAHAVRVQRLNRKMAIKDVQEKIKRLPLFMEKERGRWRKVAKELEKPEYE